MPPPRVSEKTAPMGVVEDVDELGDDDPHAANPRAPNTIATAQTAPCFAMCSHALGVRAALWRGSTGDNVILPADGDTTFRMHARIT